jgi:hypothetical protein
LTYKRSPVAAAILLQIPQHTLPFVKLAYSVVCYLKNDQAASENVEQS